MKLTPLDPWIAGKVGQGSGPVRRPAVEAYQLLKLRQTLSWVRARSPFYRRHLAAAPADLSCLADLSHLPFTTARDISADALSLVCVSQSDIQRVVTLDSTGTTGKPKRLYFTRDDQELTIDFFHVGMSTLVDAGDCVLILLPCARQGSVGDLLAIGLERMAVRAIRHGPIRDVAQTLALMAAERVNSLVGIPTQVLALARYRDAHGAPVPLKLKSALLTTDYVPPAIANAVERTWGCEVYNHYGMTEMGLGGGVQCAVRRGYHLREADLYVEIIDPVKDLPLADGEMGEVVFTTLTRRGMPLIRYRTGDLSRFLPDACACGTVLKSLQPIRERIGSRVALGEGMYLSMADLDDALFPVAEVLGFSAAIARNGEQKRLSMQVQALPASEEVLSAALIRALDCLPAVAQARSSGRLQIELDVRTSGQPGVPSPAKRTILETIPKGGET